MQEKTVIDLHCHILPGLDDGPKTIDQSIKMCQMAIDDGIRTIIATPHRGNCIADTTGAQVFNGIRQLKEILLQKNIDINILPGHELHISHDLVDDIDRELSLTLNHKKKYALLELPFRSVPFYVSEVIKQLKDNGIIPIIAHPERNYLIQSNKRVMENLIKEGALSQITGGSLTGGFGTAAKNSAEELLANNLVHVMASDAHSEKRPPVLLNAVTAAAEILGEKKARALVETNPLKITKGERI